MVAQSLRDIPDDEDVSDTEDPDLLVSTVLSLAPTLQFLALAALANGAASRCESP